MERTVRSMLTTLPFLRPVDVTVPWPSTLIRPSRMTSPMRAHTLLVPTSIATRTASRSTLSPLLSLEDVSPDEGEIVEDPDAERDECDEIEVETEAIADEGQDHGDHGIDDEARDEDAIVVDPIKLGADGPDDRVEGSQDGHRRVAAELVADVDPQDEPCEDTDQESHEGQEHGSPSLSPMRSCKASRWRSAAANRGSFTVTRRA